MASTVSIYLAQQRVFQWVKMIPGLAALVGADANNPLRAARVYNRVPQNTVYPYMTFQFQSVEPAPGKGNTRSLFVTCRFDFFSDYYGDDTLLTAFDALMSALDGTCNVSVAPGITIDVFEFLNAAFARSEDGAQHIASYTFSFYVSAPTYSNPRIES